MTEDNKKILAEVKEISLKMAQSIPEGTRMYILIPAISMFLESVLRVETKGDLGDHKHMSLVYGFIKALTLMPLPSELNSDLHGEENVH